MARIPLALSTNERPQAAIGKSGPEGNRIKLKTQMNAFSRFDFLPEVHEGLGLVRSKISVETRTLLSPHPPLTITFSL